MSDTTIDTLRCKRPGHGSPFVLRPAHVTFQRNGGTGGACCVGNIGLDILAQKGEFELDSSTMVLRLQ
jgi:hypothetical protein